ncbi:glycoside hydrolase family 43 protein [Bacteroides sp.]
MIKLRSLWIGVCTVLLFSCHAEKELYVSTSFHEPATEGLRFIYSEDGIHWDSIAGVWLKPEVGVQKVMRDPSIVRSADGTFHLVWTSSWKGDNGFGYACSKDLVHWSEERLVSVMAHDSTTVNVWAPELFYDDEKDEFMVVWASCVPYKFKKGIEDEFNNHRLYYITTKDFNTISETRLYYDPGYSSIDATLVKRASNDYVLVVKDNTRDNRNIKVAFGPSPTGPFGPTSEPFTSEFCEGPTVAKVKDDYYIYFDDYRRKIFGAVKTKDFIHFTDETETVCMPEGHKHGTIFKAPVSIVKNLINNQPK